MQMLNEYCNCNGLRANISKTKIMVFARFKTMLRELHTFKVWPSHVNASVWRCAGPRQSQHTLCVTAQVCGTVSLSLNLTGSLCFF